MNAIWRELTNKRHDEKTVSYAECHDQALVGDQTLFWRQDGVELSWKFLEPMLEPRHLYPYAAGTWGPAQAAGLLAAHGLQP